MKTTCKSKVKYLRETEKNELRPTLRKCFTSVTELLSEVKKISEGASHLKVGQELTILSYFFFFNFSVSSYVQDDLINFVPPEPADLGAFPNLGFISSTAFYKKCKAEGDGLKKGVLGRVCRSVTHFLCQSIKLMECQGLKKVSENGGLTLIFIGCLPNICSCGVITKMDEMSLIYFSGS